MKITTQRTLLWLANFTVAAGLILLVVVFAKSASRKAISKARKQVMVDVNAELDKIQPQKNERSDKAKSKLNVVFKPDFHIAGYVKPPEAKPTNTTPVVKKAPALDTLIELAYLVAPLRDGEGPFEIIDEGKVSVKIKGIAGNLNTFPYQEGETIGVGSAFPGDNDKALEEHGGAKILRIEDDGIVCMWAKKEVKVLISSRGDGEGLLVTSGGEVVIGTGDLKQRGGKGAGDEGKTALSGKPLFTLKTSGVRDSLTLTKDGWDSLTSNGDKIIDDITFESAKDKRGKPALKVSKIPGQLKSYGLQDGDIITQIDGKPVTSKESITRHVRSTYKNRARYSVTVLRNGRQRYLSVTVPRDLRSQTNLRNRLNRTSAPRNNRRR